MQENEHKYWPRKNKTTYSFIPHTILGFGKICKCFSYVLIHSFYLFILGKNISTICHRSPVNSTTGRMSTLCFDPSRHFITNLKETPSASISSYTATTVGDDVYLIVGRDSGTFTNKVDQVTDTALKFSLSTKKWQELCPIPSKIIQHQAAIFKRVLYVCGGITVLNGEPVVSRKTYAYDTEVNTPSAVLSFMTLSKVFLTDLKAPDTNLFVKPCSLSKYKLKPDIKSYMEDGGYCSPFSFLISTMKSQRSACSSSTSFALASILLISLL